MSIIRFIIIAISTSCANLPARAQKSGNSSKDCSPAKASSGKCSSPTKTNGPKQKNKKSPAAVGGKKQPPPPTSTKTEGSDDLPERAEDRF